MVIQYVLSNTVHVIAILASLAAGGLGLANAMRYPRHPLSRTRAVSLAGAGFGCALGAALLHLVSFGFGLIARFPGALGAISGLGKPVVWGSPLASILGATGLVLLALSVGEFMKLGTGEQS